MGKNGTGVEWPGNQPCGSYGQTNKKCGKCCTNTGATNPMSQNRWKFCNMIQYSNSHEHLLKQNSIYSLYLHYLKYENNCVDICAIKQKLKQQANNFWWSKIMQNRKGNKSYGDYLQQKKAENVAYCAEMPFKGLGIYNN